MSRDLHVKKKGIPFQAERVSNKHKDTKTGTILEHSRSIGQSEGGREQ